MFQYASDLHIERYATKSLNEKEEIYKSLIECSSPYLFLLGDIGMINCKENESDLRLFLTLLSGQFLKVYYLPGNHEFHGKTLTKSIEKLESICLDCNVQLLNNSTIQLFGYKIIASTLWTIIDPEYEKEIKSEIPDYHEIYIRTQKGGNRKLRPSDVSELCRKNIDWISKEMKNSTEPVIILTHHAPLLFLNDPRYANNYLSSVFLNNLEHMFFDDKLCAWIYGHTHFNVHTEYNGVLISSNQHSKGYSKSCILEI